MVSNTECVFRVTERAIPIQTRFNLIEGRLAEKCYEDIVHIDLAAIYNFYDENYSNGATIRPGSLFNALFMFPGSLMAVNWNNVGVVLVYQDKVRLYINATKELKPHIDLPEKIFTKEYKALGIAKAPVFTFEVLQPLMELVYDPKGRSDYEGIVYTYKGIKSIRHCAVDEITGDTRIEKEAYLNMCKDEQMVGLVTMNDAKGSKVGLKCCGSNIIL